MLDSTVGGTPTQDVSTGQINSYLCNRANYCAPQRPATPAEAIRDTLIVGSVAGAAYIGPVLIPVSALESAGFATAGTPLIIDSNLASNAVVTGLRAQGFNVRTVAEIFGRDIGDPGIRAFAEKIGARVVTSDRGRQLGQGFGQLAIQIDTRIANSASAISRYLRSLGINGG